MSTSTSLSTFCSPREKLPNRAILSIPYFDDLTMENEEDKQRTYAAIKEAYDYSKEHAHLQLETLDRHEILPDGRHRSTFSDGTVVTVNYADGSCEYSHI